MSHFSPHAFSTAETNHFVEHGYVKIPQILKPETRSEIVQSLALLCAERPDNTTISTDDIGAVSGIDNILTADMAMFLPILGDPLLLSIAESICGADFFPVQCFSVIKNLGSSTAVLWHQDIITKPLSKTFMLGIYLDDADDENGALRIIPKSHKSLLPLCELQEMPYQSIEMKAGDVLIHDLMLAHSSGVLTTSPQRRVVYFEFMSTQQAIAEQIYPVEAIYSRIAIVPQAIHAYRQKYPGDYPFTWNHPEKDRFEIGFSPEVVHNAFLKLKPSNYCFPAMF